MKKQLLLAAAAFVCVIHLHAQCISITCPANVTTTANSGICGAVVNYTSPQATSSCVVANDSAVFNFTGAVQTFLVPPGVTQVTIKTWGAQGGANWVNNTNFGGYVKGTVSVTPGQTLYVYVGGQPTTTAGGFNGGGAGDGAGKGGGGGTDVRTISNDLNSRLVVAGGGGGAGYWSNLHVVGGAGGGLTGGDGYRNTTSDMGGLGATQTGPGANGTCVNFNMTTMAGGFGFGGTPFGFNCGCEGYGGGGGWYGGAGSGNCRGGGGGSGYVIPAATNTAMQNGVRAGHGKVVIEYLGTSTPTLTQTAGLPSGSIFPTGITTNTFIASDAFGNTNVCSFTITVSDNQPPVISAIPQNLNVSTDSGLCSAVVSWNAPAVNDNCGVASLTLSDSSGTAFTTGTHTVVYIATDASGNADTASFTITVTDNEAPGIVCPQNITVAADSGLCTATLPNIGNAITTDNCGIVSAGNDASATYPLGTTIVTWTTTDGAGNTSTCQQLITVVDSLAPQFTSIQLNIQLCVGDTLLFALPTATDVCSPVTVTQTAGPASGSVLQAGTYTLQFSATDTSGNAAFTAYGVTVLDPGVTLALNTPAAVCEDDASFTLTGESPAGGTWSGPGVTGTQFSPSTAGAGMHVITYTFTDFNGCTGVATDTITVQECTGIATVSAGVLALYPNPAANEFLFVSSGNGMLELVSAAGQLVAAQRITSTRETVSTSALASGIYMVRYTNASGAISTARLVIQR
ncbi:MAG: HYR domain-containing protein [Bacteroidetes bacterium]|nr:HYR domain-containing protein [Bacteroidota bacterium]